jgi:hypothetical protein
LLRIRQRSSLLIVSSVRLLSRLNLSLSSSLADERWPYNDRLAEIDFGTTTANTPIADDSGSQTR